MNKYIVIYSAPPEAIEATNTMSPEQMEAGMKAWADWGEKCGDGLVDFGTPLHMGLKLTGSGSSEIPGDVMFYSILHAEDRDAAEAMLKGHPHLEWAAGCEIEVYESVAMHM